VAVTKSRAAVGRGKSRKASTPLRSPAAAKNASSRAKVRMYLQGLGDCFLVTLPRNNGPAARNPYRIMIDCGVILGTPEAEDRMTKVVEDVVRESDGHVDLLLATHAHWDHLSGFTQAEAAFKKLKVDQVWLPWTEDPNDPNGRKVQNDRDRLLDALRLGLVRMRLAADTEATNKVAGMLDFFGIGAATTNALDAVRKLGPVRYCRPSDQPFDPPDTDVRLYVMGPPLDEAFLKRTNPSTRNPETYGLAFDLMAANVPAPEDGGATESPFGTLYAIPMPAAQAMWFFRQRYWSSDGSDQWRNIETAAFAGVSELALQLDKVTNNTSLVLAIELPDNDVMLFPGDAQVGNWLSWGTLKWTVDGKEIDGPDLLKRTIFYKVGHHGSHNATLRARGLELMKKLQAAMIPVDEEIAKKKGWDHMPLTDLVTALEQQARTVIRADRPPPATGNVHADPNGLFYEIIV
jgi:hypothetical protein